MGLSLKQIKQFNAMINDSQDEIYTTQRWVKALEWDHKISSMKVTAANSALAELQLTVLPSKAKDEQQELIFKIKQREIEYLIISKMLDNAKNILNVKTLNHKMLRNVLEYIREKIMDTSPGWY